MQTLLFAFVAAQCPTSEPSCIYQSAGFSVSDASKLWNTTSCTTSVQYVVFYYAMNPLSNAAEITSYVVGTNDSVTEFSVATSLNSSSDSSMSSKVEFFGSLTQVVASYITTGSSTSLRQLSFTVSGNTTQIIPPSAQQLSGVTTVTNTITGQFVGLYADSKTNVLYVKTRYSVTFTPATPLSFVYVLGTISAQNTVNFAGNCPASASVDATVYNSAVLNSVLTSRTSVDLSVPYFANTTVN